MNACAARARGETPSQPSPVEGVGVAGATRTNVTHPDPG